MCGLLFNTLRYQGLAWERKRRDPRLHAVVCRLGYQQVSPRTISPGSACRSKADASTTQLQASKANVWAILLELKLLEPNSSESRFFFFRNPFRNASIYIYILFWFGIASRLENKPWQAASLQEFASAVSYASSRVRDPFGSLRDFDDFFCYGSTRLYTLAGIYCNILSCIISFIFSVHRGSLTLCFSAAAMIWSQFWIWFDLRKQLAQKQRLIRTFDVGGSGVKTVAWHNQPRGPSDEQGRYAWVSIKLELADSDVVQTDRYGLMGYRQVCRFGRWVR